MSDGYRIQRNIFGNYGGSLIVTPFIGVTTLVSPKGKDPLGNIPYNLYVQRVHIHCAIGQANTTWDIQDSNGNSLAGPISVAPVVTTVGDDLSIPTQDPIQAEFDYGPEGVLLPGSASLIFVPSTTGASGVITWDVYQKLATTLGFGS